MRMLRFVLMAFAVGIVTAPLWIPLVVERIGKGGD